MKKKTDPQMLDQMSRDPSNWKGVFYFNRRDPRLIVPKLDPMRGWTVNFASPYAYLAISMLVLVILLVEYFF